MDVVYSYKNPYFFIQRNISDRPKFEEFNLHTHNGYEVLVVFKGYVTQFVEGNYYQLKPVSLLFVRDNELHQLFPDKDSAYERVIINISKEFFIDNNINEFTDIFENRKIGEDNLVKNNELVDSGFLECLSRLEKYIKCGNEKVINSVMIELMYILNNTSASMTTVEPINSDIKKIIDYINDNFTENITIETLCKQFFISRSYICKKFKKYTGFTLGRYIANKRFIYIKELCRKGYTINEASALSGYNSYANFYKAYVKETGISPKKGMLKS